MNETQHLTLAKKEHFLLQIERKKCMNAMSYRHCTVYISILILNILKCSKMDFELSPVFSLKLFSICYERDG